MKAVAKRLLTKYGDTLSVVVKTAGNYNPSTGAVDGTAVSHETLAYVGNFTMQELPQDNVNGHDMKIIVALDFGVGADDTIMIQSKEYQIINIVSIVTQNKLVIQTLQARAVA